MFKKNINILTPKEKKVLEMRLNIIGNEKEKTFEQIGNEFGVTRERARQIYNTALLKLLDKSNTLNIL